MGNAQELADILRSLSPHKLPLASCATGKGSVEMFAEVQLKRPEDLSGSVVTELTIKVATPATMVYEGDDLYAACIEYLRIKDRL